MKYRVFASDKEQNVYDCTVSAYPINMVWDGSQRDISQTETAYFVSINEAFPIELKIDIEDVCLQSLEIRPKSKGVLYTICGNSVYFTVKEEGQFTLEINGRHNALHIFANEVYEYIPQKNDIYFGKGEHFAGLITPKSGQRVVIDKDAVVHGVMYIKNADNVTVEGRGILDGSLYPRGNDGCHEIYNPFTEMGLTEKDVHYTGLFNAYSCKNLKVDGIILKDSQLWTMIIRNGCDGVLINNIKIVGQWRYNSDGINLCASKNILMKNSFVRSFDDCIVVRAPYLDGEVGGCENIEIENCVLWCDWGKNLEIWSGCKDSLIRNITYKNIYIIHVQNVAMSIDTWFGSENITVEDVLYDTVFVEHDKTYYPPHFQTQKDESYDTSHIGDRSGQKLIYVTVGRLGRNLGNQQFDENIDTSNFKISYRRIRFKNIFETDGIKAEVFVDSSKLCELKDLFIEDKENTK